MRNTLLVGLGLTIAAPVVVLVNAGLDLELGPQILLGIGVGAVAGLVPDRAAASRLAGVVIGMAGAWLGYLVRADVLPETEMALAVDLALVVGLCTLVSTVSQQRISLWSLLLGAAALAGAYEVTYTGASAQVMDTSFTTIAGLIFTVGAGFFVTTALSPMEPLDEASDPRATSPRTEKRFDSSISLRNKTLENRR